MPKFIILDRDGTIIEDRGYIHKIEDLKFLPNAIRGLKRFRDAGCRFIIVTNQAGIARKLYALKDTETFNQELISKLAALGIKIEKIYICPHHPDFTGKCSCRKPETGLAKLASKEFNMNLKESIFIGDKDSDIELGKNCEGTTVLIGNGLHSNSVQPDFKAHDLNHAFELLKTVKIV